MLAGRDLSAPPRPTAYSEQDHGWHDVRLAMASSSRGLETLGKEAPTAEVTVPVLKHPPDENVFPAVQSEPPHPQLVAVAPNITYLC